MQQIGTWIVTHSKADPNLHGHCLAISWKRCPLWILFMSQHLTPPSALSDLLESVAWLISNGPHCYKLGPDRVKAECLCPLKAATMFQHTHATADCSWPWPPTTKDMKTLVTAAKMQGGFLPSSLGRFHCVGIARSAHAVPTQCIVERGIQCIFTIINMCDVPCCLRVRTGPRRTVLWAVQSRSGPGSEAWPW